MDLVAGAKQVVVVMEHTTRDGKPKIVEECSYPLTGAGVVDRIYTDCAVIDVTPEGLLVRSMVPGLSLEALQAMTGAPLRQDSASAAVKPARPSADPAPWSPAGTA